MTFDQLSDEEIAAALHQLVADGHMTEERIDGERSYRLTAKGFAESAQIVAELVLGQRLPAAPESTRHDDPK